MKRKQKIVQIATEHFEYIRDKKSKLDDSRILKLYKDEAVIIFDHVMIEELKQLLQDAGEVDDLCC